MARDDVSLPVGVDEIDVSDTHRKVNADAVKRLADSIEQIGLRHPITVKRKGDRYQLVAGLHRLEAYKKLDKDFIPATIVVMTKDEARMWEISENLHRSDLTALEKAEQIDEWRQLREKGLRRGQHPADVAVRETADALGMSKSTVSNSKQIAAIAPEAKEIARDADMTRDDLMKVAREKTPERQVAKVIELAAPRDDADVVKKQFNDLMNAWNRACKDARDEFLLRIESPIMDERFA